MSSIHKNQGVIWIIWLIVLVTFLQPAYNNSFSPQHTDPALFHYLDTTPHSYTLPVDHVTRSLPTVDHVTRSLAVPTGYPGVYLDPGIGAQQGSSADNYSYIQDRVSKAAILTFKIGSCFLVPVLKLRFTKDM